MGLDSVELIIEIERFFRIDIPDPEASKIYTVQDMVDTVSAHLHITEEGVYLRNEMFARVLKAIKGIGIDMTGETTIYSEIPAFLHPENPTVWESFKQNLQLEVPPPIIPGRTKNFLNKLIPVMVWKPTYDWHTLSLKSLVDTIYANNYDNLRNPEITTRYEIYIAVIKITAEKLGVDYYDISPNKSFTTDLGID